MEIPFGGNWDNAIEEALIAAPPPRKHKETPADKSSAAQKPASVALPKQDRTTANQTVALPDGDSHPGPMITATKPTGPERISSGVVSGLKIAGSPPVYPPVARAAHIQGTVTLHVIISSTGTVERLEAISGPEMLKGAAVDAVKNWRYKPYLLNGAPTEVDTTVIVNFNLSGG